MIDELIKERLKKFQNLKKLGVDPYPAWVSRTSEIKAVLQDFSKLEKSRNKVSVAGRLTGLRVQGGLIFADLKDGSASIQLVLKKDNLKDFQVFRDNLDIGDFLEAAGPVFKTQKGEPSIEVKSLKFLVKSLRPIPSEHFGIEDIETRLRKRYLDLLVNPGAKEMFAKKAVFWETIRNFLKGEGFLEVETPVLEAVAGGADAEPFVTHHNALDRDFYLRISLELPLKRLLVAGYEKVFEIGRVFRNEGIDREHLQEYDSLEFYAAYEDHEYGMELVEKLYKEIVKKVTDGLKTKWENQELNWGGKWEKVDYFEAFKKETGIDLNKDVQVSELKKKADALGIKYEKSFGKGRLIDAIYKKTVRQKLIQPCFLTGHPVEVSPLAKIDPTNPKRVLRFQVLAAKSELGNGWAELNDPTEQRRRFEEQMKLRAAGDKEAQMMDEDFVEALEYGMPPAFGFGLSERLFAVLMNKSIREIVIFPPMKEKK